MQPFFRSAVLKAGCVLFLFLPTFVAGSSHEYALRLYLKEHYDDVMRESPPQNDAMDNVTITHGLTLQGFEFDPVKRIFVGHTWEQVEWKDDRLAWKVSDYGNIHVIRMKMNQIWIPDLRLYSSYHPGDPESGDVLAVVSSNGNVMIVQPRLYTVKCHGKDDSENLPEDTRWVCKLKFGSWTYDGTILDVHVRSDDIDLSTFVTNDDFHITHTSSKRNVNLYACCPEPYVDVLYTIGLKNSWM